MPIKIGEIQGKISIAGNGIVALMVAYLLFLRSHEEQKAVKITIRGKYPIDYTTAAFLVPSLSWNEILSVVPPGKKLLDSLQKLFTDFKGGIRLEETDTILLKAKEFIDAVESSGNDEQAQHRRTELLVEFSKLSLSIWELIYQSADQELRNIFDECNFLPCRELSSSEIKLRDGYRLDVYYEADDIEKKLQTAIEESMKNGYKHAQLVSPDNLLKLDTSFKTYVNSYSTLNENSIRVWNKGAGVILRPGGCVNTPLFLKKFSEYMQKIMGTYLTEKGIEKPRFKVKLGEVTGLQYAKDKNHVLAFEVDKQQKTNKHHYIQENFILCPGEKIGTVRRFGLFEPPHARFVGFSLKLSIPEDLVFKAGFSLDYKSNMAIRTGAVSSSVVQVGKFGEQFSLGIGGLKAFLGLDDPDLNADYAIKASLYQLNMLNKVYAPFISVCLGKNTQGTLLTSDDLNVLIKNKFLTRWTGSRACAFDGAPTVDYGYNGQGQVDNLLIATHLSSGGVTNCTGTAILIDALQQKKLGKSLDHRKSVGFFDNLKLSANLGETLDIMKSQRGSPL